MLYHVCTYINLWCNDTALIINSNRYKHTYLNKQSWNFTPNNKNSIMLLRIPYYVHTYIATHRNSVLGITVGHWPFSYQFHHLADQNLF